MSIQPQYTVEQAIALLQAAVQPIERRQRVPLVQCCGRVLAEDLPAQVDVPPFDRSPLDGYALRQADLAGASADHPVCLQVTQRILAGQTPQAVVAAGEAARIMTGAPVPPGADCVVRQEDTDMGEKTVNVYVDCRGKSNIIPKASDTKKGTLLLRQGSCLNWTHLPLLASQGYGSVPVYGRPKIAIINTGDELVPPGTAPLPEGKIYNSNSAMIMGRLAALGAEPVDGGIGPDDPEALAAVIRPYLESCDMVITSGGVSVGQKDCMPLVADRLKGEILFHGVAAKPGTPTMAFTAGKPVLCLSGNPFAAGALLELLGRPMVEKLRGSGWQPTAVEATLRGQFPKSSPVRRFIRGRLIGGTVEIADGGHESGSVFTLAGCNCLLDIPANRGPLVSGDRVMVLPMDGSC